MEPETSPILFERHSEHVAVLRLNRPHRLNAVSLPLYSALRERLISIENDKSVRSVVITGMGRAFCVGADLKSHGATTPTPEQRAEYVNAGQEVYRLLQTLPQPVVAAVNGHAIGAGIEVALSCDLVVVSREAKLRLPELGLGTFVGGGTIFTLAQRVGQARAKELILLGDFFYANDPVAAGLATRTTETAEVFDVALDLAEQMAAKAPLSVRFAKELLRSAQRSSFDEAMRFEAEALLKCMHTKDWREGIDAYNEKRTPRFIGE